MTNNLNKKQLNIIKVFKREQPRITILHGAKRSGKTFLNNVLMLSHIAKFNNCNVNFIIVGATSGSIWRNVLNDWEIMLNDEFKLTKDGSFRLFGNNIYIFGGEKADSWKKMRGMTSHGTYINEATALHQTFVTEAFSRTSGQGAKIFIDTNPDNPSHFVKKDYIDKSGEYLENGKLNILSEHFRLDDNEFLINNSPEYVESIKNTTPQGATYDRDILGLWVAQEGVIYRDFSESGNVIESIENIEIKNYYFGIDWGFEHYGVLAVIAVDYEGNYYLVKVTAKQHQYFDDYWKVKILQEYRKYKPERVFCDGARAEYVKALNDSGIYAENAIKDVKDGINLVGALFKRNKLKILREAFEGRFKDEIYSYVWGRNDEPIKENDDIMDTIRYVLYSLNKENGGIAYLYSR